MEWIAPVATVIVCVILPYVVNLVKKNQWNENVKRWLAIGMSIVVGICAGVVVGAPTPETFLSWVLTIVGGTQVAYAAFKSIGITSNWLDALEGIGSKSK